MAERLCARPQGVWMACSGIFSSHHPQESEYSLAQHNSVPLTVVSPIKSGQ